MIRHLSDKEFTQRVEFVFAQEVEREYNKTLKV
jgi:hypothetical protein